MQLTFSPYSIAGLMIMFGIGLFILGMYQRWIYPAARRRHEKAKVTGSQGSDPGLTRTVIKITALLILPALGFLFGDPVLSVLHR